MRKIISLILALAMLLGVVSLEAAAETPSCQLEQVVVLSRHNIRSPLSEKGSFIHEITPHEWFEWTSRTSELSLKGAMLETTMGQYFRLWLESQGLFPENYLPEEGAVRFYANGFQRTQATAHYFSTGLLPVAVVPVECKNGYNQKDPTFLPLINFMNDEYLQDVLSEIEEQGGAPGLSGYRASLEPAYALMRRIVDMEQSEAYASGKYGDLENDLSGVTAEAGDEPRMYGPMKEMNSLADALVLQYYEEPDDLKAAFGHEMTDEDWKAIGNVLATYEKILFAMPSLAANLAHPMLMEMYQEMNTEGRKFSFLCGHDSTITSFLAALGVEDYELPGAVEPTTPIGTKVVFERWADPEGKKYYKVNLVYQSVEQMRGVQALSLENPPMIVPLSFKGVTADENGMIAEADMMNLFREKIGMLRETERKYGAAAAKKTPEKDIVVLFTSDVHCGIDENFTYAGLKAVKDTLTAQGVPVLLVDDGDSVQGGPSGIISQGMSSIQLMNELGYDVVIPGNHEFDYGMSRFFELVDAAEFPYISVNFRKNGEPVFKPYIIKETAGVKIAFVGTTTPGTISSSTPRYFQDEYGNYIYDFMQGNDVQTYYGAIQTAVDQARSEGADYVILLAHLGNDTVDEPYTYADVVAHTTGIDAVLDGHSHDTDKVTMKNSTGEDVVRQACGTRMECIGWLRISAADGSVDTSLYRWGNPVSAPELLGISNSTWDLVQRINEEQGATLKEVVGTAAADLTINDPTAVDSNGVPVRIVRTAETNLGDLCTDAIRAVTGADVALVNGGSIRVTIPKGEITVSDVMKCFPFGNKLMKIEATGQQLLDALEWGARNVPQENGGFLHVSGMSYEIHTDVPSSCVIGSDGTFQGVSGEYRVKNVRIGDEYLDPDKTYVIGGQSYTLVDGGDGQTAFRDATILWESDQPDYTYIAGFIRDNLQGAPGEEYADPYGQGRIVAKTAEERNLPELPEGVEPVTWKVSKDELMIRTEEARTLYEQIAAGNYPSMEELLANPVVQQLDALAAYYKAYYGNTAEIDTPERDALRKELMERFLTLGAARTVSVDDSGRHVYVYDGELKKEYLMEVVLGLPASGKSTRIVDPDSEAMGAFVLDPDVIKAQIPEYVETNGAAADAVHFEGMKIWEDSLAAFTDGEMKGTNVVMPLVISSLDELLEKYIKPFENAGYHVKVKYREAKNNEAAARVVMRELAGGQLINSKVAFVTDNSVEEVYEQLKDMLNADGEPYGYAEEAELAPAA